MGDAGSVREQVMNDMMNTSVMGALIGGFALGNLTAHNLSTEADLDNVIYMLNVVAIHASTCSSLTSAFVYRHVNYLSEGEAAEWCVTWSFLTKLPIGKFAMGCISYMTSVLLITYRGLVGLVQIFAVVVGLMSIASVIFVALLLGVLEMRRSKSKSKSLGSRPMY